MKRVGRIIDRELVFVAIKSEAALGNAVGVPSDRPAEKGMRSEISLEVVESQNHIGSLARAIRHPKLGEGSAVTDQLCRGASAIAKQVRLDDGPVRESTEEGLLDRRFQAGHRLFFEEWRLGEEPGNAPSLLQIPNHPPEPA